MMRTKEGMWNSSRRKEKQMEEKGEFGERQNRSKQRGDITIESWGKGLGKKWRKTVAGKCCSHDTRVRKTYTWHVQINTQQWNMPDTECWLYKQSIVVVWESLCWNIALHQHHSSTTKGHLTKCSQFGSQYRYSAGQLSDFFCGHICTCHNSTWCVWVTCVFKLLRFHPSTQQTMCRN